MFWVWQWISDNDLWVNKCRSKWHFHVQTTDSSINLTQFTPPLSHSSHPSQSHSASSSVHLTSGSFHGERSSNFRGRGRYGCGGSGTSGKGSVQYQVYFQSGQTAAVCYYRFPLVLTIKEVLLLNNFPLVLTIMWFSFMETITTYIFSFSFSLSRRFSFMETTAI